MVEFKTYILAKLYMNHIYPPTINQTLNIIRHFVSNYFIALHLNFLQHNFSQRLKKMSFAGKQRDTCLYYLIKKHVFFCNTILKYIRCM